MLNRTEDSKEKKKCQKIKKQDKNNNKFIYIFKRDQV